MKLVKSSMDRTWSLVGVGGRIVGIIVIFHLNIDLSMGLGLASMEKWSTQQCIFTNQELQYHPFHSGVTEGSYHSSLFTSLFDILRRVAIWRA